MVSYNAIVPEEQRKNLRRIPYNCHYHHVEMEFDANKTKYQIVSLNNPFDVSKSGGL